MWHAEDPDKVFICKDFTVHNSVIEVGAKFVANVQIANPLVARVSATDSTDLTGGHVVGKLVNVCIVHWRANGLLEKFIATGNDMPKRSSRDDTVRIKLFIMR